MSSKEIVRIGQGFEQFSMIPLPKTITDLPDYFEEKERADGSFIGFEGPAESLVSRLDGMAESSRINESNGSLIAFNPALSKYDQSMAGYLDRKLDPRPFLLYDFDNSTDSQAFIDLAYHLTKAEEIYDTRHEGEGYVVARFQHQETDLYFIEHHSRDLRGANMMWAVNSVVPEEVYEAELQRRVIAEQQSFEQIVMAGLRDILVLDSDPEQLKPAA
ncbi:hypothetical protein KW803_03145 [Candidatus Saccharibacteria bacterium]|nr:hypothetical protein [Candidatus Saccharibacteria bacterium]